MGGFQAYADDASFCNMGFRCYWNTDMELPGHVLRRRELLDPAAREVVGGLWGRTELGLLFIDMFFLPKHVRGQSQGARFSQR